MSATSMSAALPRYPFRIPFGWFQVSAPEDLAVGQTKALYYFDRHLVLWRDESGDPHVMDAFCPHLGAHLGHGGTVKDCQIVCPFHGWAFDADGQNVDIPYSERLNHRATIATYPTVERNGKVLVWFHPQGEPPKWDVAEIPEIASDEFSGPTRTRHTVKAGLQEMGENQVDSAHFRFLHRTAEVPEIESYEADGHISAMRSVQRFPTPRGVVDGRIDTTAIGPGISVVWFTGIVDTLLVTSSTPISDGETETFFDFYVRRIGDDATTSGVAAAFVEEVDRQFVEDTPIWEHKAHLTRPALADTDGPFMKFRKWYAQFYVEPVADERTVFPPPYWPDKMDESPAGATASARYDQ
jgi:phenylpropionate dioxygenase-like ring-hydroxylating dioxygenase large terminal subunit